MLKMEVSVQDSLDRFSAQVSAIGIFKFSGDVAELNSYFYTNAPAIMYPYVRSYVSALTALSGLPTINLPVMKMALGKKLCSQTVTI